MMDSNKLESVTSNGLLKNILEPCHSERSEESRTEIRTLTRFRFACGSSE